MNRSIENRDYWDDKAGITNMALCEKILQIINKFTAKKQKLNYQKSYITFQYQELEDLTGCNFINVYASREKTGIQVDCRVQDKAKWSKYLKDAGINSKTKSRNRTVAYLTPETFKSESHQQAIKKIVQQAVRESKRR